jgi:hypothetical protein
MVSAIRACSRVSLLVFAASVAANDLIVDARTLQMNDLATITVSLEGHYAAADSVKIPLRNLAIVGEPWVSSEFAWINGQVVRRKVFRYRVRPIGPGPAQVGPLIVSTADGQRENLGAVALEVLPDSASRSNDAATVLDELLAMGRDPLFVVAESDKKSVYAGEPVLVTWWLYNGARIQDWQVLSVPKLEDFWTEEIQVRGETPQSVFVGSSMLQRVPIRRIVVYPLRSGALHVGGMSVEASIMRRVRGGVFGMFEGNLIETTFTSAPVDLDVKPLPPGPPVDAVGELMLTCEPPRQRSAGPVIVQAVLTGAANLRSVPAPRFGKRIEGDVETEGGEVTTTFEGGNVLMTRRWRYLVFPARGGMLEVPALSLTTFVPHSESRQELQCGAALIEAMVTTAQRTPGAGPQAPAPPLSQSPALPWVAGGVIGALFAGLAVPRVRRQVALRREVREIVEGKSPAEIRAAVELRLGADPRQLLNERSDRGDAYRALRSILDAVEKDRDLGVDAEEEVARRVRDLLTIGR